MFGFQPQDLLVILLVALVIFGPSQLPKIARALGETLREFRKATDDVKKPVEDAAQSVRASLSEPALLVFVSSIMNPHCDDLVAERAAAKKAIEALPVSRAWRFEDSPASPETTPRVYLRKVQECDIFVLVLGKEITHPVLREYATARKHKHPRLAFLKKCDRTPATQQFVRHIGSEVKWKDFGAAPDLEKQIQIAIVDLLLLKFREKFTANEIIALTGLLAQLNQWLEAAQLPVEPETPAPRVHVLEPEQPRIETPDSLFTPQYKYGKDGKRMILIPAGEFLRGTSDADILEMNLRFGWDTKSFENEKPQRRIDLDAYNIAETPVTNEEYKKFVDATGHRVPFDDSDSAKPYNWDKLLRMYPIGSDNYPVVNVTWDDANAYAHWAGGRLPTEAEWEKAARGTDGRFFPWGNEWDRNKCNTASWWMNEDITRQNWDEKFTKHYQKQWDGKRVMTTPVGQFKNDTSPYGCLDMAGNVWEWCVDWYDAEYYKNSPAQNPKNETAGSYRVLRGGSWSNYGDVARGASRADRNPDDYTNVVGFRVVVSSSLISEF